MNCKVLVVTYIMITTISPLYNNNIGQVRDFVDVWHTLPNTPEPVGGFNRQALVGTPIEARERVGKFEFEFRH